MLIVHPAAQFAVVPDILIVHTAVQFAVVPDMLIVHTAVQFAVVPDMLIVHTAAQFAALYGARNFAASFTAPVSEFYPQPDESSLYPRRIFPLRSVLNSPTVLCSLMLPLLLKPLCKTPLHFSIRDISLTHLRHVALITELILGEDYSHEALQHVFVTTVCTSPTAVPALRSAPCRAQPTAGCLYVCLNAYTHRPQFVQPYNSHCVRSRIFSLHNVATFRITAIISHSSLLLSL